MLRKKVHNRDWEKYVVYDTVKENSIDKERFEWERRCIMAAREGDSSAFGHMFKVYVSRIYTHLYRMLGDRAEAEDMTQEAFIRAFRSLHTFDVERPFKNWLYRVATNTGLNALRSRKRRGIQVSLNTPWENGGSTPADWLEGENGQDMGRSLDMSEQLSRAIAHLPPRTAALLHMHYFEGMTLMEAGEVLGISENAAKVAVCRARAKLREWFIENENPTDM